MFLYFFAFSEECHDCLTVTVSVFSVCLLLVHVTLQGHCTCGHIQVTCVFGSLLIYLIYLAVARRQHSRSSAGKRWPCPNMRTKHRIKTSLRGSHERDSLHIHGRHDDLIQYLWGSFIRSKGKEEEEIVPSDNPKLESERDLQFDQLLTY